MKKSSLYFRVVMISLIGSLTVFSVKHCAPVFKKYFGSPVRCASVISANETANYCLDERYRVPLDCIFDEGKENSERCRVLWGLSERNKVGFSFSLFGYKVEVNKILSE